MSDTMLLGILRMPPGLWRNDAQDKAQRYSRYKQAATRIEADLELFEEIMSCQAYSSLPAGVRDEIEKIIDGGR